MKKLEIGTRLTLSRSVISSRTAGLRIFILGMILNSVVHGADLTHRYELDGDLLDTFGGASLVSNGAGFLDNGGYRVPDFGSGLSLTGAIPLDEYAIEVAFSIDLELDPANCANGPFVCAKKLVDYNNRADDNGIYAVDNPFNGVAGMSIYFDPVNVSIEDEDHIPAEELTHMLITRDAANNVDVFLNGILLLSHQDISGDARFQFDVAHFLMSDFGFLDDAPTGFIDRISVWDGALTADEALAVFDQYTMTGTTVSNVPAGDCAEPGGCDLGGQIIELPDGVDTSGGIVTRIVAPEPEPMDDGVNPTILADGRLILPPIFRSSSPITILEMHSNLVISQGTVLVTIEPADFLEDSLTCDQPIPPDVDPQLQDIMVWQPTNAADIREGHAIEITSDCGGSSRGRSRGLSFFTVGLHVDCGLDYFEDPWGVKRCFGDLTLEKFHGVLRSIKDARRVMSRRNYKKLRALTVFAKYAFHWGFYELASHKLTRMIEKLESIDCRTSEVNLCGDIEMRAHNLRFNVEKVKNIRDNIVGNY